MPDSGLVDNSRITNSRTGQLADIPPPTAVVSCYFYFENICEFAVYILLLCLVRVKSVMLMMMMMTKETRHRASTSMYRYSLTFCVRVMLPERHQWKPAVQAAAVMLRTPPSPAGHRPAARADPAERSHYMSSSRDGRKLVTRVRVMLP